MSLKLKMIMLIGAVALVGCAGAQETAPEPTEVVVTDEAAEVVVTDEEASVPATEDEAAVDEAEDAEMVTTESGLQYTDEVIGEGEVAETGDLVRVHYMGTLDDGTTFDSSVERGEPFMFKLGAGNVIQGWDEGVAGMRVGGKRTLVIPPDLGYGEREVGSIPANSTLTFDVELLEIVDLQPAQTSELDMVTTESGLQYGDIEVGTGAEARAGSVVAVHYAGWLQDGTMFDNSYERGQPFVLQLGSGQVIPGWDEGLVGMKAGGKRQLIIPPDLAYGETGTGPIPPNATLIFDVELVAVQ